MQVGDLPRDRQPESGSTVRATATVVETDEPLEDPIPIRGGHAGPVVGHRDQHVSASSGGSHADCPLGIPLGVVEQVADSDLEEVRVALDRESGARSASSDAVSVLVVPRR